MVEKNDKARRWGETLQSGLMASMDAEWEQVRDSRDAAAIGLAEKRARMLGTFARSAKAVIVMVPDLKQAAAPEGDGDEDEADMHGEIPDDPDELRAAVESKVARLAELLELKRRGGNPEPAEPGHGGPLAEDDAAAAAEVPQRRTC